MKKGWQEKKLGDIFIIERGGSPRPIEKYLTNCPDGINWIKIGDTKNVTKYIYKTNEKIIPEGARKSRMVYEGDFILSNSMSFGKPFIMKTSGCIHDGWLVLREKERSINKDFLYYILGSNLIFQQFDILAAGSTVRNLNIGLVSRVVIPFPPLPEQQRIVEILDQSFAAIDQAIEKTEKNYLEVSNLFQSTLDQCFQKPGIDWEVCNLEDHVKFIDYRGHTPLKLPQGMRLITAKNVKNGFLQIEPREYVDPDIYDSWMVRGIPKKGDVLFTTEAPLANVAQLDTDEEVLFAQRIIILQPDNRKIKQTFLKYLLLSTPIRQRIFSKSTGATVQGIKSKWLKKVGIYFPKDLCQQEHIISKLDTLWDNTKNLISNYDQKLSLLQELKQSILHKAFNGEL